MARTTDVGSAVQLGMAAAVIGVQVASYAGGVVPLVAPLALTVEHPPPESGECNTLSWASSREALLTLAAQLPNKREAGVTSSESQ